MKKVKIDQQRYDIPNSWNELTTDLLIVLANLFAKESSPAEIKTKLFITAIHAHVTSRDGKFMLHTNKAKHVVSAEEIQHAASVFDFLFVEKVDKQGNSSYELNSQLSKNPFPSLPCSCSRGLYGPNNGLISLKYVEFIYMLTFLGQMQTDFDGGLNRLVATLYRHQEQPFSIEKVSVIETDVVKSSRNVRIIVWFFVLGCLDAMAKKFPKTFSGSSSTEKNNTSVFDKQQTLLYQLSNNDVTKAKEIQSEELYQVLYHIENSIAAKEETDNELKKRNK